MNLRFILIMTALTIWVSVAKSDPFAPPQSFFNSGVSAASDIDFDVTDFGAVADAAVDNTPFIQAAIDAAADDGGGMVYIPSGTYGVDGVVGDTGAIYLQDNVYLKGAGMGQTRLRVLNGIHAKITGIVRSPFAHANKNYGLADLTLDGNRDNSTPKVDGFFTGGAPGQTIADKDVTVIRVEATNNSGYGFDPHEQTHRLVIRDCVAHGNGLDGFVADFIVNSEYSGNVAYNNDRHGFNLTTTTNNFVMTDNTAYQNGSAGIVVQRGSEDFPLPHDITINGGEYYDNGKEGILLRLSKNIDINGVNIHDNGTYGLRIRGTRNVIVSNSTVSNNSQSKHDKYANIQLLEEVDNVTGTTFASVNNLIENNVIEASGSVRSRYGVEERAGSVDTTTVTASNQFIGNHVRADVKLVGVNSVWEGGGANDEDDVLVGTDSADVIDGLGGNDQISGKKADDELFGSAGNDYLNGGSGDDLLDGGSGDDELVGGTGADILVGGSGNDIISGGKDADTVDGGSGNDTIVTDTGSDTVHGGSGNDFIRGKDGDDILYGDAGNDIIDGGKHNDIMDGGAGDDNLNGGKADDTLIYKVSENVPSHDFYDGALGVDTLRLIMTVAEQDVLHTELDAFQTALDENADPDSTKGTTFKFNGIDLDAKNFELLEIEISE